MKVCFTCKKKSSRSSSSSDQSRCKDWGEEKGGWSFCMWVAFYDFSAAGKGMLDRGVCLWGCACLCDLGLVCVVVSGKGGFALLTSAFGICPPFPKEAWKHVRGSFLLLLLAGKCNTWKQQVGMILFHLFFAFFLSPSLRVGCLSHCQSRGRTCPEGFFGPSFLADMSDCFGVAFLDGEFTLS